MRRPTGAKVFAMARPAAPTTGPATAPISAPRSASLPTAAMSVRSFVPPIPAAPPTVAPDAESPAPPPTTRATAPLPSAPAVRFATAPASFAEPRPGAATPPASCSAIAVFWVRFLKRRVLRIDIGFGRGVISLEPKSGADARLNPRRGIRSSRPWQADAIRHGHARLARQDSLVCRRPTSCYRANRASPAFVLRLRPAMAFRPGQQPRSASELPSASSALAAFRQSTRESAPRSNRAPTASCPPPRPRSNCVPTDCAYRPPAIPDSRATISRARHRAPHLLRLAARPKEQRQERKEERKRPERQQSARSHAYAPAPVDHSRRPASRHCRSYW